MGLNATAKDIGLTAIVAVISHFSLHTNAVGSGSGGEISGGTPAYARKSVTWGASSGGVVAITNQPVFDIPASTTVARAGLWSAASGGTYYGDGDVADEFYAAQGTYTITAASISITG